MEAKRTRHAEEGTTTSAAEDADVPDSVLNFWYPVCYVFELDKDEVFATELFGEPLVLFRNSRGKVVCIQDVCPHRSTPLSIGFVKKGELFCRYHGWRFGGESGECTTIPSLPQGRVPSGVKTQGHPVQEAQNLIWVFPGDDQLAAKVDLPTPMTEESSPDPKVPVISQVWDSDYSYIQVMENLMDPCHLQFTHEGQQQKNIGPMDQVIEGAFDFKLWDWREDSQVPKWSIVAHVQTTATKAPLNYKLIAEPPVLQRAEIRIQDGKGSFLTINHYVVPLRPNKTRIFLKLARNFITFIPPMMFANSNDDVMQQDVTVLTSQMARLRQGAHRWNYPVKADGASMSYRKTWESWMAKSPDVWFKEFTRTNVCKDAFQKGCIRANDAEIEDLPAHIWPMNTFLDEQKGIESMWNSPAGQKWTKSRKLDRTRRAPYALGYQYVNPLYGDPKSACQYVLHAILAVLLLNAIVASIVFWIEYARQAK